MKDDIRLQVKDVNLRLQDFQLTDINLSITQGEYFVLLGPTGAGKTILLEVIAGVKPVQKGRLYLDGEVINALPPEKRQVGFVYQDYALFPHLTVRENIAFGLRLMSSHQLQELGEEGGETPSARELDIISRQKGALIEEKVQDISKLLHIEHLLARKPASLSGGEKQRTALARALVIEPRVLLLDEPLSALDPETSQALQRELKRIHNKVGTTTLHITHNFEEAVALADRIGVIFEGRIHQVGTPQQVFRKPSGERVARFVGVRNILQGQIEGKKDDRYRNFHSRGVKISVVTDQTGPVRASIRPEDIILARGPVDTSARNAFQATVLDVEDRGSFVYVTVRLGENGSSPQGLTLTSMITRRSLQDMELSVGDRVHLAFKAAALHIL